VKHGIALIGFGYWGPNLARNLNAHGADRWHSLVDTSEERRKHASTLYPQVRMTDDLAHILDDEDTSSVIIATPAPTHYEIARRCLNAGKHVFVEKPLTESTAEAVELAQLAEARGLVLMVGHIFEYVPAVRLMRRLIADGEIGDLRYLHAQRYNLGRIESDTTAYWTLGPHDVSIANYLVGADPVWVSARGASHLGTGEEDVTFIVIGYPGDVLAHLHISWLEPMKTRRTTVLGSRRSLIYDDMDPEAKLKVFDNGTGHLDSEAYGVWQYRLQDGAMRVPRLEMVEPLAAELQDFLECTLTGERPQTDGWSGVRVVAVLEAVEESLRAGGERVDVTLPVASIPAGSLAGHKV
jgi:predicted dehydrogenase